MNDGFPNPGWYQGPFSGPDVLQWWDGEHWTEDRRPAGEDAPPPAAAPQPVAPLAPVASDNPYAAPPAAGPYAPTPAGSPYVPPPAFPPPYGAVPGAQPYGAMPGAQPYAGMPYGANPYAVPGYQTASRSGWDRNQRSYITFIVVAVYLFLAMTTGLVFVGFVPVMMSVRAATRREPLAPLAIAVAVIMVVVGFAIRGH